MTDPMDTQYPFDPRDPLTPNDPLLRRDPLLPNDPLMPRDPLGGPLDPLTPREMFGDPFGRGGPLGEPAFGTGPLDVPGVMGPPGGLEPAGDPMLDGLERSIEDPLGLGDPWAGQDGPLVDDIGRQLDALEAEIESALPVPPPAAPVQPCDLPTPAVEELETQGPSHGLGDAVAPAGPIEPAVIPGSQPRSPADAPPPPPVPPSRHARRLVPPGRRQAGRRRGVVRPIRPPRPPRRIPLIARSAQVRLCPDRRELVGLETCEACVKYRHWPEGTDEPPRECWHDWQSRPEEPDPEPEDGDE